MKKDLKDLIGKAPTNKPEEEVKATGMDRPKGNEAMTFALSEADKEKVREKARGIVAAKFKKRAEEQYLAEAIKEIERESIPEQQVEPILINVAGHADKITLDGRQFAHGRVYYCTQNERETLEEIMSRTWGHEKEVGGANFNHYRKPVNAVLRPGSENISLAQLVHV